MHHVVTTSPSRLHSIAFAALISIMHATAEAACPQAKVLGDARVYEFDDGSIAMRTHLNVNPDGNPASYTVDDHGFTYVANGMTLWDGKNRHSCKEEKTGCRRKFIDAERKGFKAGTAEFCVFAIEVEPFEDGRAVSCGDGRTVIGNGKGKLRIGQTLQTVTGASIKTYVSTTALMHKVGSTYVYIDSARVPALVGLEKRPKDRGVIAWVRSPAHSRETFAVVGDLGPAFGEGSIALHQLLRYDELRDQKPGPIPVAQRCQASELDVKAPYGSYPDDARDTCKKGHKTTTNTDIRAKVTLDTVDTILLGKAAFKATGNKVDEQLTAASIAARAEANGYTTAKIREMAACIR